MARAFNVDDSVGKYSVKPITIVRAYAAKAATKSIMLSALFEAHGLTVTNIPTRAAAKEVRPNILVSTARRLSRDCLRSSLAWSSDSFSCGVLFPELPPKLLLKTRCHFSNH